METTPLILIDKTIGLIGRTGSPPVLTGYCAQRNWLFWALGVVGKWTSTYMVLYICAAPSRVTRLIKAAPQLQRTEDLRWSMALCGTFGPRHRVSLATRSHDSVIWKKRRHSKWKTTAEPTDRLLALPSQAEESAGLSPADQ
jgi:hypothetical protein